MCSCGPPHMAEQKQDDQLEHFLQQLCDDTGCNPEDRPKAMNDRETWRERFRDIRASRTSWRWYPATTRITLHYFLFFFLLFLSLAPNQKYGASSENRIWWHQSTSLAHKLLHHGRWQLKLSGVYDWLKNECMRIELTTQLQMFRKNSLLTITPGRDTEFISNCFQLSVKMHVLVQFSLCLFFSLQKQ